MRVLYVSHTAATSGAEVSLLELIEGLPAGVSPVVACPEGDLASACRVRGVPVEPIPAFEASFRLHPMHTVRGLLQMLRAARAVRRSARRHRPDIVHANSVRAGLAGAGAWLRGGPPMVVHVRDCLPRGAVTGVIRRVLGRAAAKVIANSAYTAGSFTGTSPRGDVLILHSPIDLERFDPGRVDREQARARLGLEDEPALAVVGQITPWKGHVTALQALALSKPRMPKVKLLVVGSVKFAAAATRYDNEEYLRSLEATARELGLEENVRFTGERDDVPAVLRAIDLLLVPSAEEPFGRVVVEAMAMETPVIATRVGGPAEVIDDRVTGRLVAPGDPEAWAAAILELMAAADLRREMGRRARGAALRFDRGRHVEQVVAVYRDVLAERAS
jgi:glycosyltransferase involved in cell wall biosynthesis